MATMLYLQTNFENKKYIKPNERDAEDIVPYEFKLKFDFTERGAARTTFCAANSRDAPHGVALATLAFRVANMLKDVPRACSFTNR